MNPVTIGAISLATVKAEHDAEEGRRRARQRATEEEAGDLRRPTEVTMIPPSYAEAVSYTPTVSDHFSGGGGGFGGGGASGGCD